jgi:hypothetical protein
LYTYIGINSLYAHNKVPFEEKLYSVWNSQNWLYSYNEEAATVFNVHAPLSNAQRGRERDSIMDAVASALCRGIASWMQLPAHYATPPTDIRMATCSSNDNQEHGRLIVRWLFMV